MKHSLPAIQLRLLALLAALIGVAPLASAQEVIAPNSHLRAEGVAPIPAALAAKVAPYTDFRPRRVASWHPKLREMIVASRTRDTTQLHRVSAPGAALVALTDYADPVRGGAWLPARTDSLLFVRDTGGNEQTQVYRLDPGATEPALLTDPARAHRPHGFDRAKRRLIMTSVDLDKSGKREDPTTDLWLLDPLQPEQAKKIATLQGTGWGDFSISFDDRRLALTEYKSANEAYVWVMDLASGERVRVLPDKKVPAGTRISSGDLQFARDGKGLFLGTDRDGEFRRAAYLSLASGKLSYIGPANWDVESLHLSPDGRVLATITNEAGVGVLRLYDAATRQELARPALPVGTVSGAVWHDNSVDLAVNVNSAQSPGDVWSVNVHTGKVERWTTSSVEGLDAGAFQSAAPIEWTSFDARRIGGFITRPPKSYTGKRPVLLDIHGGPEGQARPGFIGRWNYYVNELGLALIEPNVRGSAGYGKTFLTLDDGVKREDSVKDIGSLLDWIGQQPDLDAARVLVTGGSYGGYMSLAVATHYADRIAGSIDVVGIANFVSFLQNTESYRRDLRRVEYGDERDPTLREFLTRISPVNNADRIAKPLFVVHGRNDPRVPYTEAEQIVTTARKNGVPVWYLLADNEGHGFGRKENADFLFYSTIVFMQETLLR